MQQLIEIIKVCRARESQGISFVEDTIGNITSTKLGGYFE